MNLTRFCKLATAMLVGVGAAFAFGSQAPKAPESYPKGWMWEVSDGQNTIYMVGSVHMATKKMYPLPPYMLKAFHEADELEVEFDVNKAMGEATQLLAQEGIYTNGDSLWKHVDAKTKADLTKYAKKNSMELDEFALMKPWLAFAVVSIPPSMKSAMNAPEGIDVYFLNHAGSKKIVNVESLEFQLKMLSSIPIKQQVELLDYTVTQPTGTGSDGTKEIESAWIAGDTKPIESELSGSEKTYPKDLMSVERSMLEDRNPHMADVAEKCLKSGKKCFFVVGCAHYLGPDGIVAILQKRGYKVDRVLN